VAPSHQILTTSLHRRKRMCISTPEDSWRGLLTLRYAVCKYPSGGIHKTHFQFTLKNRSLCRSINSRWLV